MHVTYLTGATDNKGNTLNSSKSEWVQHSECTSASGCNGRKQMLPPTQNSWRVTPPVSSSDYYHDCCYYYYNNDNTWVNISRICRVYCCYCPNEATTRIGYSVHGYKQSGPLSGRKFIAEWKYPVAFSADEDSFPVSLIPGEMPHDEILMGIPLVTNGRQSVQKMTFTVSNSINY